LRNFIHRGDKNKIFLDNNGLEVFKRLKTLEDNGKTMKEALNIVKQELGQPRETSAGTHNHANGKLVETLEKQVTFLMEQLKVREKEIDRLHKIIEDYLPALPSGREEEETEVRSKASRWYRLKQFIKGV